jgi:hypothetical protein
VLKEVEEDERDELPLLVDALGVNLPLADPLYDGLIIQYKN